MLRPGATSAAAAALRFCGHHSAAVLNIGCRGENWKCAVSSRCCIHAWNAKVMIGCCAARHHCHRPYPHRQPHHRQLTNMLVFSKQARFDVRWIKENAPGVGVLLFLLLVPVACFLFLRVGRCCLFIACCLYTKQRRAHIRETADCKPQTTHHTTLHTRQYARLALLR